MTAKEKAKELVEKYSTLAQSINWTDEETKLKAQQYNDDLGLDILFYWNELTKKSALIAVDEIIRLDIFDCNDEWSTADGDTKEYWKEVKHEIEKF